MIFQDRVTVVTGASQGIGEAIAREFARHGAAIALLDVQKDKLEAVARAIVAEGGRAEAFPADVTKSDQTAAVVEAVLKGFGRIDHLINNAGITRDNLFMRMKEEEWDAVMAVNLKGVFNLTKAVVRPMLQARYGRIVNLSSIAGEMGNAGQTNYAASKAGLIGFSKSLARETAARNVTVNCVAPGFIATAMTEALPENVKTKFRDVIPMGRFGEPADVARAVRFLCSEDAAYITGQVLNINGGMYM
ncbi:MAG: 3-oxoacyl-[acyl-carrier-protein] reductase [Candidatus Aminicenantes bacterium]|nr:3-oxoacyl-[acyl-carrier-protein] reductase [Candidatus Aminicenantes bacterium]